MKTIPEEEAKRRIAWRIAKEFNDSGRTLFINLGVGTPTMVADYIENPGVFLQAENGMLGLGPAAREAEKDLFLINAGRIPITERPGCSYFDSALSFGMIRGGHIDATVIGAFEVDGDGNIANWIIPNGKQLGVGGAMDLVAGAKKVYVAMTHRNRNGAPKIVSRCTLPVTGYGEADCVVTEYGVFDFSDGRLVLREIAPEITLEELRSITAAPFEAASSPVPMFLPPEAPEG
jgi:3-oxoacid CoA-transferase B subunit